MQYTKYFSFMVKENGQPNINNYHFRRIMNIIYLEGVINGLNKVKRANKDTDQFHRYDITIFKEERKLTDLTGNLTPELLLNEMIRFYDD